MAQGDQIPDTDHVAHYCPPSALNEAGKPTGLAFRVKTEELFLSVDWLEHTNGTDTTTQVAAVRIALGKTLTLKKSGKLAVLNVGETRDYVAQNSFDTRRLRVAHEPEENNPHHAGIHNLEASDDIIADLIAEVVRECYPARDC